MSYYKRKHTIVTDSIDSGIAGVYILTNKTSFRIYIGSAIDIRNRWGTHERSINDPRYDKIPISCAIKSYGANGFRWEILEVVDVSGLTREDAKVKLIEREQYYLDLYQPFTWTGKGYNHNPTAYSCLGRKQTGKAAAGVPRPNRVGVSLVMGGKNIRGVNNSKAKRFRAVNSDGKIFIDTNLSMFCEIHGLNSGAMQALARGEYMGGHHPNKKVLKSYKGWIIEYI